MTILDDLFDFGVVDGLLVDTCFHCSVLNVFCEDMMSHKGLCPRLPSVQAQLQKFGGNIVG